MHRDATQPPSPSIARFLRRAAAPARRARLLAWVGLGLLIPALAASPAAAEDGGLKPGGALANVKFDQNLDAQVPLNLRFRDGSGRDVVLAEYFGRRPVILVLGYKNCPLLCSQVLGELTRSLKPLSIAVGQDFDIVQVSINPKETPAEVDGQRRVYLKRYNRPGAETGWHALVGDEKTIEELSKAIGFRFQYSATTGKYAHASGFVVLTPTGKISRYFYGVEYPARDLQAAIALAGQSKIDSPIQRVILYCYDFDPTTGHYTFAIMSVIRVFGVATALALGIFLVAMVRRDRRMGRATDSPFSELPSGPVIS